MAVVVIITSDGSHLRDKNLRTYIHICTLIVLSGLDTGKMKRKGRPRRNPNAIIYDASRFPRHVFRGFARTFNGRRLHDEHGSNGEERKSTKGAQTPKEGRKEGKKGGRREKRYRLIKEGGCNEPKEARVLKCLFEFLAKWPSVRSAGHSSQPESNEITRIYILWFTSLSSAFSAPSPLGVLVCRPSTTHTTGSSSLLSLLPSSPTRQRPPFRAVGEPCGEITDSLFMGIVTNNRDIREIWNNFGGGGEELKWRLCRKGSFSVWNRESRISSLFYWIGIFVVQSVSIKSVRSNNSTITIFLLLKIVIV